MLPQTFRIPGRRHNYVDLNDVFEMYELSGRFRDWLFARCCRLQLSSTTKPVQIRVRRTTPSLKLTPLL